MSRFLQVVGGLMVVSVALLLAVAMRTRVALPPHLLNHKIEIKPNLLSEQVGDDLMNLIKTMKEFPSNTNDLQFYKTVHEHVGEAIPIGADGRCNHPFLIPDQARTMCILPGRIDIGRHYTLTGGFEGLKESYEDVVSRVQSFGRYMFNMTQYKEIASLFTSESFLGPAKNVCPSDKQYLDPFQFNFIMQVPGQTVAAHVDGVYFWGATRFQVPQWLLAVMVFSGLFQDRFIDQIQTVAYVHRWRAQSDKDGAFVYWNNNEQEDYISPTPLSGSVVDGSKTVHAALVYRPDVKAPRLDKSEFNALVYHGDDKWTLSASKDKTLSGARTLRNYTTNDLRISIVYRARCFRNEGEAKKFAVMQADPTHPEHMTLEQILGTLREDLVRRNIIKADAVIAPLDFALLLQDVYIKYPLPPHALLPYNYCMASLKMPFLKPFFDLIC